MVSVRYFGHSNIKVIHAEGTHLWWVLAEVRDAYRAECEGTTCKVSLLFLLHYIVSRQYQRMVEPQTMVHLDKPYFKNTF